MDSNAFKVYSVFLGLLSHIVCNRYEPSIIGFIASLLPFQAAFYYYASQHLRSGSLVSLLMQCHILFFVSLGSSMAAYRLLFHPLRRFPGPLLGKLTKFATSYHAVRGDQHLWIESLHRKYGDTVRFGPNELSFINPDDLPYIQGSKSARVPRGPWYDGSPDRMEDSLSMVRTRNFEVHRYKRRIWEQAFTLPALTSYEPKVLEMVELAVKVCVEKDGQVIDVRPIIQSFTFDTMGKVGFSRDYGMVDGTNVHAGREMRSLAEHMRMLFMTRPTPWLKHLYRALPLDAKGKNGSKQFKDTTLRRFEERYQEGTTNGVIDIMHYLMQPEPKSGKSMTKLELSDEAVSLVIAGSDTTSVCLTYAFYYLLTNREAYSKLQKEVDSLWDGVGLLQSKSLVPSRAPFIDGVINEALRLAEPDPNGNQRSTPPGGFMVNGEYIPEGTQMSVHKWSIHRSEKHFTRGDEFIPERWISDEERARLGLTNHNVKAFIPFGAGQYGCVGRPLALNELRMFLVGFFRHVDISPCPGHDLSQFTHQAAAYMTFVTPPLPVVIRRRKVGYQMGQEIEN
ncbi:hypothetical protein CLAIMM_09760 [Cladophialophora immunda]|nr:hypothetical protein CLAIMM_09760 [Cladophialophora immunda]